jgi:hypothetical protein
LPIVELVQVEQFFKVTGYRIAGFVTSAITLTLAAFALATLGLAMALLLSILADPGPDRGGVRMVCGLQLGIQQGLFCLNQFGILAGITRLEGEPIER